MTNSFRSYTLFLNKELLWIGFELALFCEKKHGLALATFAFTFLLTGCLHPRIGPQSVPRDRVDYSSSLSDSWKEETLLNIVKVRYLDPPIFTDVGMSWPVTLWRRLFRLAEQSCRTEAATRRWAVRWDCPTLLQLLTLR